MFVNDTFKLNNKTYVSVQTVEQSLDEYNMMSKAPMDLVLFRFAVDSHHYQCVPGKAFSGLTRVVWELAPVKYGQGGTLLATGSHKAAYTAPESYQDSKSQVWDTYECPAGSVLFFTEGLAHSTCPWTNTENARVGIFNLYNSVGSQWGRWEPPAALVERMPPQRQTLFRGVHCADNVVGYHYGGENQRDRRPRQN